MGVSRYFDKEQQESIVQAIKEAERITCGEIRVHIESTCKGEAFERAIKLFNKLEMYKTQFRNGVLIYVAVQSHKFAIIGDTGINNVVPENFWNNIKENMRQHFVKGLFTEGIVLGIKESGIALKQYFPCSNDDINEQPDEISFGK